MIKIYCVYWFLSCLLLFFRMNRLTNLPRGFGAFPELEVLDLTYNNLSEKNLPGNFFMIGMFFFFLCVCVLKNAFECAKYVIKSWNIFGIFINFNWLFICYPLIINAKSSIIEEDRKGVRDIVFHFAETWIVHSP